MDSLAVREKVFNFFNKTIFIFNFYRLGGYSFRHSFKFSTSLNHSANEKFLSVRFFPNHRGPTGAL